MLLIQACIFGYRISNLLLDLVKQAMGDTVCWCVVVCFVFFLGGGDNSNLKKKKSF